MKKWLMAQSMIFKIAFAVACVAIVAIAGTAIALNISSNAPKQENQVVDISDGSAPATNAPAAEPEVKQEAEVTEPAAPAEEPAKEPVVEPAVVDTAVVEETQPVVEQPKVKTGYKLENGSFKDGLFAFQVYAIRDDYISYETGNSGFSIDINNTGTEDWHVQLKQNDVRLENGKWYRLTLSAKSSMNRSIRVSMMHDGTNDDNWTSYANAKTLELGKNWKTYTVVFQMNEKTDNHSVFNLAMGTVDGNQITKEHTVSINNIKLEELPSNFIDTLKVGGNLIANADFAYEDLLWQGSVVAPGAASVSFENNRATFYITDPGTLDWHVQLKQAGITLENETGYRFTFDVTSSVERIVKVGIMDTNYVNWYGGGDIYVAPGTKSVSVDLYNSLGSNSNALLMISLGKIEGSTTPAGTVAISNVRLEKNSYVSAATVSYNGGGNTAAANPTTGLGGNWEVYDHENAHTTGSYVNGDGTFVINVSNTGSEAWHVQLTNKTMSLEKGKTYRMSFAGKSTVARDILYMVQMNGGAYTPYSAAETVALTTEWQTFTQTFTMNYDSDSAAVYNFSLGKVNDGAVYDAHTVMIKDIVFEEVVTNYPEKTENGYVVKPTHDKVTEYGNTFWKIALDPADYGLDAEAIKRKTVKISATVKSEGTFKGQLGTCTKADWTGWVGNGQEDPYAAGEYDWSITAEDYQGSPQFQFTDAEAPIEITNIKMEVVEESKKDEETPKTDFEIKATDEKVTEGENLFWKQVIDPSKFGIENPEGKNLIITMKVESDGEFSAQLGACYDNYAGWADNAKDGNYNAGEHEWALVVPNYKDALQVQVFYMGGTYVNVKDVKISEAEIIVESTSDKITEGDNSLWKVENVAAGYGLSDEALKGKTVVVTANMSSAKAFTAQMGAVGSSWVDSGYTVYPAGDHALKLIIPDYQCALQFQIFAMDGQRVAIHDVNIQAFDVFVKSSDDKVVEGNNSLWKKESSLSAFGVTDADMVGKTVTISAKVYSEGGFVGQIGACAHSDYSGWVDSGYKSYPAGTSTLTMTVEDYIGAFQFQVFSMDADYVGFYDVQIAEKQSEDDKPEEQPSNKIILKTNETLSLDKYAENLDGKKVKITVKFHSEKNFNGALRASQGDYDAYKQYGDASGDVEWTLEVEKWQGGSQIEMYWSEDAEVVSVTIEEVQPEEQPSNKIILKTNETLSLDKYAENLDGKKVKITVKFHSEKNFNGALRASQGDYDAYKQYGDASGDVEWTLEVEKWQGGSQIEMYWSEDAEVVSVTIEEIQPEEQKSETQPSQNEDEAGEAGKAGEDSKAGEAGEEGVDGETGEDGEAGDSEGDTTQD